MSPLVRTVLISLLYALTTSGLSPPQLYKTENVSALANRTFDYVIVGGGTAGLTIAARLSEQANVSVAVIEAGGNYELDHGNLSTVPAYWSQGAGTAVPHPDLNVYWGFKTVPQTVCLSYRARNDYVDVWTVIKSFLHLPKRKDAGRVLCRQYIVLPTVSFQTQYPSHGSFH